MPVRPVRRVHALCKDGRILRFSRYGGLVRGHARPSLQRHPDLLAPMKESTMNDYDQLLTRKLRAAQADGFEPMPITSPLFDWQKLVVRWAIKRGRAALFEEC